MGASGPRSAGAASGGTGRFYCLARRRRDDHPLAQSALRVPRRVSAGPQTPQLVQGHGLTIWPAATRGGPTGGAGFSYSRPGAETISIRALRPRSSQPQGLPVPAPRKSSAASGPGLDHPDRGGDRVEVAYRCHTGTGAGDARTSENRGPSPRPGRPTGDSPFPSRTVRTGKPPKNQRLMAWNKH